ncbi:MAG: carboxypeptidase regulatory-like domain-containing protein, partial [Bacteroidales bacterium]|nr:carboxypeptidase regulatory-like domain-containing protein [Bacteroidales bacterium]
MFKKVLMTFGLLLVTSVAAFGQGTLKGVIVNAKTNEPEPFVNVKATQNGEMRGGAPTNMNGEFTIKPLAAGVYDIEVSAVGFHPVKMEGVTVKASGSTYADTIKL